MLVQENRICDKCQQEVVPNNNVVNIEYQIAVNDDDRATAYVVAITGGNRHFMPNNNCEGSPSRNQYIIGQPKAKHYKYIQEEEENYRLAYQQILSEKD